MIPNNYIVVAAIIMVLVLWWFYSVEYRNYRIDLLRYRIFGIRQELFDLARSGRIAFDHPAYCLTRNYFNGMIRIGHKLSLTHLVLVALWLEYGRGKGESAGHSESLRVAFSALPEDLRSAVMTLKYRATVAVLAHVAYTCPFFFPLACIHRVRGLINTRRVVDAAQAKPLVTFIDAEATRVGQKVDCEYRLHLAA